MIQNEEVDKQETEEAEGKQEGSKRSGPHEAVERISGEKK